MSLKSGKHGVGSEFRSKKGQDGGINRKKMGGRVGYEKPNEDTLTVAINRYTRTAG